MSIIKLEHVGKSYRDGQFTREILKKINLEIGRVDTISITGKSGCGKTTLLQMIALLEPPTCGEIFIGGLSAANIRSSFRAMIRNRFFGYVLQDFALVESETVRANILVPLIYSDKKEVLKNRQSILEELTERLDIDRLLNQKVRRLSGGEKQRVAIARALINRPRYVLADEPTGALDDYNAGKVMDILLNLPKQNTGLILVTHNTALAEQCERRLEIRDKQLLEL